MSTTETNLIKPKNDKEKSEATLKDQADRLKKPNITTPNFWNDYLVALFDHEQGKAELNKLKLFIQATDNGFMLQNILENFVALEEGFEDKRQINHELKKMLNTAKILLERADSLFSKNFHCRLDAYLTELKKININKILNDEILRVFVEYYLFSSHQHVNYKTRHPIYVALFYPYIADDAYDSFSEALYAMKIIRAHAFNLIASDKQNKKIEYAKNSLYQSLTRLITNEYTEHILLEDLDRLSTAEDFSHAISHMIDFLNNTADDRLSFASLVKKYDYLDMAKTINSAIVYLGSLRRFFNYFIDKESDDDNDSEPVSITQKGKYNTSLGIVRLGRNHLASGYYQGFSKKSRLNNVKILVNSTLKEGITGESLSESIIIDTSTPCNKHNPSVKVISASSRNHHIALYNQYIGPALSGQELKHYFDDALRLLASKDQHELKIGINLMLFLLTSRSINKVQVYTIDDIDVPFNKIITLNAECSLISFPIDHYNYKSLRPNPYIYEYANQSYIILRLPKIISEPLQEALISLNHKHGELKLTDTGSLNSYLVTNSDELGKKPISIGQSIFYYYLQASDGDLWLASLITGESKHLAHTQKHYASCKLERVEALFLNYLKQMFDPKELSYQQLKLITSNAQRRRVGSPVFVKESFMNTFIEQLYQKIQGQIDRLTQEKRVSSFELIDLFNMLCFYTDLMIAFSTGMRNITDPYVKLEDISLTGWTQVNDKNLYNGYNTRLVFVPVTLREHLREFEKIQSYIIRQLTTRKVIKGIVKASKPAVDNSLVHPDDEHNFSTKNALFLFDYLRHSRTDGRKVPNVTLLKYSRAQALKIMQALIFPKHVNQENRSKPKFYLRDFKLNMNRHYLRGKLMDKGVTPAYIDAYLGHWHLGTEPWGKRSLFSMSDYQHQLAAAIDDIVERLGFKAIRWSSNTLNAESTIGSTDA